MRSDARARRDALIRAAAACFLERGYSVSLEDIAERAGVGRGTLYRNFTDRMALILAIFERELDGIEAELDVSVPLDRFLKTFVVNSAHASALFAKLAAEMPLERTDIAAFEQLGERLAPMFEPVATKAHADGALDGEVDARQLRLVTRMLGGLVYPYMTRDEMEARIEEALPLLLAGLRPR